MPLSLTESLKNYGKLPLSFEANRGQFDARVKFVSRQHGLSLALAQTEAVIGSVRMRMTGANRNARISGAEPLQGKTHYFLGNDPQEWRTDVPTYARVKYESVYPGIDLVFYGNGRQLEYDFIVAPGADPDAIKLSFADTRQLQPASLAVHQGRNDEGGTGCHPLSLPTFLADALNCGNDSRNNTRC